ncbi:MAG: hypothetical protein ABIQ77_10760, partial [Anaerolineales bacterium]
MFISACGPATGNLSATQTPVPLTLPPTWTPTPAATIIPTFTEFPTFTPIPAFTPLAYPTNDAFAALLELSQETLISPNGLWVAYRDPTRIRVVNAEIRRVWTLPCELFEECKMLLPLKWSHNSQFLYFAAVPTESISPAGIHLFTALASINIRTGKWELLLSDSDHYYDFTFSQDEDYLAYTQSSGALPGDPSVTVGFIRVKNKKGEKFTLKDDVYGGNIVWSPFKPRFVFQTRDDSGSSIGYFDMETSFLKYVITDEQSDLLITGWGE